MENIQLDIELQQVLTTEQAWHYGIVPAEDKPEYLRLYMEANKIKEETKEELEILFGKKIVLEPAPGREVQRALGTYYRKKQQAGGKTIVGSLKDDLLPALISEAKNLGSSDIHIEAYEEKCRVRIRVDGMLVERLTISREEYPVLINKIKISANLDIAEKRLPQDGRIFFNQGGNKFDIRCSVVPTLHGEKVVLRLLSNDATNIDIRQLGFSESELEHYLEGIKKPTGIMLISGPTGSGKTTSLYATLKLLNKERTNIVTIEDPIEYTLEGINQVQLRENIGLTFASALRTFLRQDPDIIMLGEIRDRETAQMAIRASLTGHLVLSTIHTNSAWGIVSRLADMGVEPFLLANTLNTLVAQRLVRLLCTDCRKKESFSPSLFPRNFKSEHSITEHAVAGGCDQCHYTGYRGRKAIYEVIPVDYELSACIRNNTLDIAALLKKRNIPTLAENAYGLFRQGETSLEDIYPYLLNSF